MTSTWGLLYLNGTPCVRFSWKSEIKSELDTLNQETVKAFFGGCTRIVAAILVLEYDLISIPNLSGINSKGI